MVVGERQGPGQRGSGQLVGEKQGQRGSGQFVGERQGQRGKALPQAMFVGGSKDSGDQATS